MISGRVGFGRVDANFPSWCSWVPFADYMGACQVPTIQQLQQSALSDLGPAASSETRAAAQQAIAQGTQDYCSSFPADCADVSFASENPNLAAMLGLDVGPVVKSGLDLIGGVPSWVWLAGAGIVVVLLVRR